MKKMGIRKSLIRVTVIPVVLLGMIIIFYCCNQMMNSIYQEVESGLKSVAKSAIYMVEKDYPGDYRYDSKSSTIYKGEQKLDGAQEILEAHKKYSGADITIFYKDMRILTTIRDDDGKVIVGTKANSVIKKEVLDTMEEHFYTKTTINGQNYFSYYYPLYDNAGNCIGMGFAGKPSEYVRSIVLKKVTPIILIIVVGIVGISIVMWNYANNLTKSMQQLQRFLQNVEQGNFNDELGSMVLKRKDELGKIGKSALRMQVALRGLIQWDSLTGLYNRHYGEMWLKEVMEDSEVTGVPFSLGIGDIDFFKKFNDRYGHDCGDIVLREVSMILKKNIARKGYAARWGGEEFLLVFSKNDEDEAYQLAQKMLDDIRNLSVNYNGETLGVTMTFGVVAGDCDETMDELIKKADQALYEGKEAGRNRVVQGDEI